MKNPHFTFGFCILAFAYCLLPTAYCFSQQPLPVKTYLTMRDSTTSMDIVMMQGKGGSMSLDGRNVKLFNNLFENKTATKFKAPLGGNMMWLVNGREFISGSYFLGDSTGYVVFNKDGKEYVNLINAQGNSFFKGQIKQ